MARITTEPKQPVLWPYAALLLFLAMLFNNSYAEQAYKVFAVVCGFCGVAMLFIRKKHFSAVNTPIGYSLAAYVLLAAFSLFYGVASAIAVNEFARLFISFVVFLGTALYMKNSEKGVRNVLSALAWSTVPIGILSVDAASTNLLMRPLRWLASKWGMVYDDGGLGFFNRLTTIFDNANVYAGVMSVAVLLSFYLAFTAVTRKQRIASNIVLLLNTACYMLAISMGSIFFFLLACVLYLVVIGKGNRLSLFILILEDAVISLIVVFGCMLGLSGDSYTGSPIPLLSLVIGCALFTVCDIALRDKLSTALSSHKKAALGSAGALIVVVAAFTVAALHIGAAYTLQPGESLSRSVRLPAGEYTLSIDSDEPVDIIVNSKSQREMLINSSVKLTSGTSEEELTFTVPEGSKGVFIISSLPEDCGYAAEIASISYSGAKSGSLIPKYVLLPSFIANRYQELTASGTAAIRTMFFRDGLQLWLKHPVLGNGMATFNNGLYSVQRFYYGTKYIHNHYIQMLCDFGVVGLLILLSLLGFVVVSLVRGFKKNPLLAAALSAACFQIFGQAMTDVTWSAGAPLLMFFAVFAVISTVFGDALHLPEKAQKTTGTALRCGAATISGVLSVLLIGNVYGNVQLSNGNLSFDNIPTLCVIDHFDNTSFRLSYLLSSASYPDDAAVQKQAAQYLARLKNVNSATAPVQLAAYYNATGDDANMKAQLDRSIELNRSDSGNWSSVFNLYETKLDPVWTDGSISQSATSILLSGDDTYLDDALAYYDKMCAVSAEQWDDLNLEPNNTAFLGKLMAAKKIDPSDTSARLKLFSTMVYDSDCATDVNADGIPDFITSDDLSVENGVITTDRDTQLVLPSHFKVDTTYELKIETDTPDAFTAAYFDTSDMPYTVDGNTITSGFTIPEQLAGQNIDLMFDVSRGAHITRITLNRVNN